MSSAEAMYGVVIYVTSFAISVGLIYFINYLRRIFRGGMMESAFKFITFAMIAFGTSELFALVDHVWQSNYIDMLSETFLIAFSLLTFYGFYKLFKVWSMNKETSSAASSNSSS